MSLIEQDAHRLAASLDDYEQVSLRAIRPKRDGFYEVVVTDHRFECDYALGSHCDYWDFVACLVSHLPYPSLPLASEVAR